MADMYICPKAKFCNRKAFIKSKLNHCIEHEKDSTCDKEVKYCPACIPSPSRESMREKIAEIVNCMREDKKGDCEFCSWPEDLCPVAKQIKALEALIAAETAAMRDALHRIYELIDINLPYCDRCDDIRDIVMKFEGGTR